MATFKVTSKIPADWEQYEGFVVNARNEKKAIHIVQQFMQDRRLMAKEVERWTDGRGGAIVVERVKPTEYGIVLESFRSG